jgi:hypothetical protein
MRTAHSIHISKDVLSQEVAGETVLLDLSSESYFGLDEVGTRVWAMLKEGAETSAIVETLLGDYEVGRTQLEADLAELLDQLEAAGLITRE